MSARAQNFGRRTLLALALACAAGCAQAAAQDRGAQVTASQVAQAVERVRAPSPDEGTFARALALGGALLREGRFAEAAELFGAVADKRPRDPFVLYGAALATFNAGRKAEAEPLARRAVEAAVAAGENRPASDALVLLAVVLAVRGDNGGALAAAGRAVQLAPDNFDAQFALGRALYGAGDAAGAARAFRAAVALRPTDAGALFFLATALERGGDAEAALSAYREAVARRPGAAEGHLGLGVLLVKRGGAGTDEGLKELGRALEINPNLYEARVTLGRTLVVRGRAAEAVEHLRRAAELAPGNPEPRYQLVIAYRRLGRKEEADRESAVIKRIHESRRGAAQAGAPIRPEQ